MTSIAAGEIRFHPHSFGDPAGRLFWWRGDLYRGVRRPAAPFVTDLVDRVLPRLVARRLVPATTLTDLTLDGFEIVLRHEQVPFTAYPTEWCPEMLREASRLYLDLVVELAADGLGIKDMNPWNLVFDGPRPLFVDVMSIAPVEECLRSFSEERFRRYYLDPLRLMGHGHSGLARALLPDYGGVDPAMLALLRGRSRRLQLGRLSAPFRPSRQDHVTLARSLRREIDAVELPAAPAADADGDNVDTAIARVLEELRPASVLELRTATAATALVAARRGGRGIAFFDRDEHANRAFAAARGADVWLLPLVLDFTKATPAVGFFDHFSIAAVDRLRCELVIAGDAVRYAVVDRLLPFEHVAEALAVFSIRYALASLPEPTSLPAYALERAPWYGAPAFIEALRARFAEVTPLSAGPSEPALFLCRK
jgi:hypothetical protein